MIDEMQKGLDLEHGPLLRVTHVKPNLLVVVIHIWQLMVCRGAFS